MIIDAHAHLVAPSSFYAYRSTLLADGGYHDLQPDVSDDALAEAAGRNVEIMDGVGTDVQLLSPRPYQQMNSAKPERLVTAWIRANNNLIARTVALHPDRFAGVAGLALAAGAPVESCLDELDRTIEELGFVGVSLNPDLHEGAGYTPTLDNPYWYPLYERLAHYDVPAHVHSSGCFSGRESYSEHFITEESIAVLSLLRSEVFAHFPTLKVVVSHGGGSVPYQVGRWQAERLHPGLGGAPANERFEVALRRLWFDTVLHHRQALELLFSVVGPERCLFGTERPGSGTCPNPDTGRDFDDLKPVIESIDFLSDADREAIFTGNALMVFSRLSPLPGSR